MGMNKFIAGSVLGCVALLAGCGGGGGDSTSTPTPTIAAAEGVFSGTVTGSTNNAFTMLILENGDFWTLYGQQLPTVFSVAGIVQGTGTSSNGAFTSSSAKNYGAVPAIPTTLSSTYSPTAQTITGTMAATVGTVSFSGGPSSGSLYNYNTPATLSSISGTWSTTSTSGEAIAINVAASGAFTAISRSGCGFSGTVSPRASGKNVFNTTMTFGAAPCGLPGQIASGIAVVYPLTSGKTQVIFAQVDSTKSYGSAAFGIR